VLPILRPCRFASTGSAKYTRPMPTKAELIAVRALQTKNGRREQGLFLVQGAKLVAEALGSTLRRVALYATEEAAQRTHVHEAIVLPPHELQRMGTLESGNEVVAVMEIPIHGPLQHLAADELVLALDGIADPGNLGTILRIADWFGIRRVLCSSDSVDVYNPKCVQASMGAIFRVETHYAQLPSTLAALRASGAALHVASMEGEGVFGMALKRPVVLVLGNESHGVSQGVRELHGTLVSVPRVGAAESLNVAMAASALCMEYTRQHQGASFSV
jgi:RNA methyltransferase, TrmH family